MIKTNPKRVRLISKHSYKQKFVLEFLGALRTINRKQITKPSSPRQIYERYLKVKKAADASMASAVGSTRTWSRALLLTNNKPRTKPSCRRTHNNSNNNNNNNNYYGLEENGFKENELRKVVPGGEAMDMCSLLEETAHYIKCLNTQVKLMRKITDFYTAINIQ